MRWTIVRAFVVLAILPGSARADGKEPTASERDTARSLMVDGDALFSKKAFEEALKKYLAADALMRLPTTGVSVAKAEAATGKLLEAREKALAVAHSPVAAGERAALADARTEAADLAGRLVGRIPAVAVHVKGVPAGEVVTVRVDDAVVPPEAAEVRWNVDPGAHVVAASTPHAIGRTEVTVPEGGTVDVAVELTATAAEQPIRPVKVAEPTTDHREQSPTGARVLAGIGFGLGAVGAIAGAATGAVVLSKSPALKMKCTPPATGCPMGELHTAKNLAIASDVALSIGGAGVILGIVGAATSRSKSPPKPTSASAPSLSDGALGWSF